MATAVAQRLSIPVHQVFVGSTGVIGRVLPIDRIEAGLPTLISRLSRQGGPQAAQAILTTDLRPKTVVVRGKIGGRTVTIGGMAKGLIEPPRDLDGPDLGPEHAPEAALDEVLGRVDHAFNGVNQLHGKAGAALTVRHAWPPDWSRPATGKLAVIQPWEFGSIPIEWVQQINLNVDELWVPSRFVSNCYIQSGVTSGKVQVVPNGVAVEHFHPVWLQLLVKEY